MKILRVVLVLAVLAAMIWAMASVTTAAKATVSPTPVKTPTKAPGYKMSNFASVPGKLMSDMSKSKADSPFEAAVKKKASGMVQDTNMNIAKGQKQAMRITLPGMSPITPQVDHIGKLQKMSSNPVKSASMPISNLELNLIK